MSDQIDIKVSEDLVRPIIEAKINAAICAGLVDQEKLLQGVASRILNMKVNSDGKRDPYNYSDSLTLIQYLAENAIKEAAQAAIKEWAESKKEEIKKSLIEQLKLKKNTSRMVEILMDGIMEVTTSKYRFKLEFEK